MVLMLGFTGILGKLIELSNTHLVWYRMLLAFITLFLFAIYKKQLFKIPKKTFLSLLGIGLLLLYIGSFLVQLNHQMFL